MSEPTSSALRDVAEVADWFASATNGHVSRQTVGRAPRPRRRRIYAWPLEDASGRTGGTTKHRKGDGPGKEISLDPTTAEGGYDSADLVYRLTAIRDLPPAARVVVAEGEKAADAIVQAGFEAMSFGNGTAQPSDAAIACLRGRRVDLWPDNDEVGLRFMSKLSVRLEQLPVASLCLVVWPEAPEKGDAADADSDTIERLISSAHLISLPIPALPDAGARESAPLEEPLQVAPDDRPDADEPRAVVGRTLEEFLAERDGGIHWAVQGAIVDEGLVAFEGPPESFKSSAAVQFGLAIAGGPAWLGLELGERRPFVYVSNEKSVSTVRERFRRLVAAAWPTEPVRIVHRAGVTFGDRNRWAAVLDVIDDLGRPALVVCDTLASLAGPGFDENSGRDMSVALAALRQLSDRRATTVIVHHPAKHTNGTGGVRLRGHSSLWGEVDGVLGFSRPDRAIDAGTIRVEPKDGDLRIIRFRWDRETYLIEPEIDSRVLTARTVAETVDLLYDLGPVKAEAIAAQFPAHGRSRLAEVLAEAVSLRLVVRVGRGRATVYGPGSALDRPDDSPDESTS